MTLAGSHLVLPLMSYARGMTSRVRTTMSWLHLLGCFAASDSFVLDGLVNETGLHLGMENMIAAAQRTHLQLVTQHIGAQATPRGPRSRALPRRLRHGYRSLHRTKVLPGDLGTVDTGEMLKLSLA